MRSMRPVCLACVSFDVEAIIDEQPVDADLFACFECEEVFYFMADTRPRVRRLGLFEVYERRAAGPRAGN